MEHKPGAAVLLLCVTLVMHVAGQPLDVCSTCHVNATCDDKTDGSGKVCNCKYGFVGNGRTLCQDKDECQIGSVKICGQHSTCHNTYGSYFCTCLSGFRPTNDMGTFIPNDGTSCQDIDECEVRGQCGEGGACSNLEGSFQCHCQTGFKVHNGAEPFQPIRDKAVCKVVDCGSPAPPKDSVLVSVTKTTFEGLAVYKCEEGFIWRSGENVSVCEARGLWTAPSLVCEELDCGPPPAPLHARRLWGGASRVGSEVLYGCDPGYRSVETRFHCSSTGQWGVPAALCQEIVCGSPPSVESSVPVWDGNSTPGSTVAFYCKHGFSERGGRNVSVCTEHGEWTRPTLVCKEIVCEGPPLLPHTGRMWNSSLTPGSAVTYFCKSGFYYLKGSNVSVCTVNGYWTKATIMCKEINCGLPHIVPKAVMLWDGRSTMNSLVVYQCNFGYRSFGNKSVSLCLENGQWENPAVVCQEIHCGRPVDKPNTKPIWDGTAQVGAEVYYECNEGFYPNGLKTTSKCEESGLWEEIELKCEEVSCGPPWLLPHTDLQWDGCSDPGCQALYQCVQGFDPETAVSSCSHTGQWGQVSLVCKAQCGPAPAPPPRSLVLWQNRSVVLHRCEAGYHSWSGSYTSMCDHSGLWSPATITCIKIKPPILHLHVLDEKCLHWEAEKNEESTEVYTVRFTGSRDYQPSFLDRRRRVLSSKADRVELCLNLLPATNYSISVTAASTKFTASISTNTSLTAPAAPVVHFREFETPLPTLTFHRSPNTLDLISIYEIYVLPVDGLMVFDCSSPKLSKNEAYITARVQVKDTGTEVIFTLGDGQFYGGFLNAPLESSKDYYVVLRAVNAWRKESKSTCILWATVKGLSFVLTVSSLSAAVVVGLVALAVLVGYSYFGFFKKL